MQIVDDNGKAMHRPFPARVPDGDIRALVAGTGGWFPHPVMSGLTFTRAYARRLFPVPDEQRSVERGRSHLPPVIVDTYLAGPAALLAPVAGIQAPLTRYRVHGTNRSFVDSTQGTREGQLQRYRAEAGTLSAVMREEFGKSQPLEMEDHLEYQLLRYAAGEISWGDAIGRVVRCPYLPATLKVREALRLTTTASE